MIARLLNPSSHSTRFSVDRLPAAVHESVLQNSMTPIVNSESMTPTLQKGDVLRLQHADNLQVGDVIVYRHDQLFVCHRIHRIDGHRMFLRGDRNTGPFEDVDIRQVVGRVEALFRNGTSIAIPNSLWKGSHLQKNSTRGRTLPWSFPLGRARALRFVNWVADRWFVRRVLRHMLKGLMTIDILERTSLRSLDGYVARHHIRLDQLDHAEQGAPMLKGDGLVLVIRVGPVLVGTCSLNPWGLHMRPLLRNSTTEVLFESIGPFVASYVSSVPVLTSAPGSRKQ
ncbi:MAG: S26 family signal peptidase [Nitrospira sp.]